MSRVQLATSLSAPLSARSDAASGIHLWRRESSASGSTRAESSVTTVFTMTAVRPSGGWGVAESVRVSCAELAASGLESSALSACEDGRAAAWRPGPTPCWLLLRAGVEAASAAVASAWRADGFRSRVPRLFIDVGGVRMDCRRPFLLSAVCRCAAVPAHVPGERGRIRLRRP